MKKEGNIFTRSSNRRAFLKNGTAAGAATMGAGLLAGKAFAFDRQDDDRAPITRGDIAILTFLSALEQVEADLWIQYAELGGATNQGLSQVEVQHLKGQPITFGNAPAYVAALQVLDRTCRSTSPTTPTMKSATINSLIIICSRRELVPSTSAGLRF
jgi:hypothetical protein